LADSGRSAQVFDTITFATLGRLADAQVQVENSVRTSLKWVTKPFLNPRTKPSKDFPSPGEMTIEYQLTLLKGGNKVLVRAAPKSASQPFSAKGQCVLETGDISAVLGKTN
jgi:hypothetical protein